MVKLLAPPCQTPLSQVQKDSVSLIEYPEDGNLRSRKVISRSKARPTGKYPSWKMGRMIHWESVHERNAFLLLDANPVVRQFHEQPLVIHYTLDGEVHRHYPDILVLTATGKELWEVKTKKEAASAEVVARTRLMFASLPNLGFIYRVVHGEDLAREPRLSNVIKLLTHGRTPVTIVERELIRLILAAGEPITWGLACSAELGPRGRAIIARLALEGVLVAELEQPLTETTVFAPAYCNRSLIGVLLPLAFARNNASHIHQGGACGDQGDSDQQQVAAA